jgi:hypothetical protein
MQTKIEIPKGHEIDQVDTTTGEVTFRPLKDAILGIRTVEDLLAHNGLTQEQFDNQCAHLEEDEKAYRMLKLLAATLNQGWTPNWNDDQEYKYSPYFYMGGSAGFRFLGYDYWDSASDVGSRLCFKSYDLARHAGTHFLEVYRKFMII